MGNSDKKALQSTQKQLREVQAELALYKERYEPLKDADAALAEKEARRRELEDELGVYEAAKAIVDREKEIFDTAEKQAAERERKRQELEEARRRRFESYSPEKQAKILARRERAAEREKERAEKLARENAVGCVTTGMTAAEAEKESELPDTSGKTFEEVAAASAADSKGFEESKSGRTATEACGEKETEESNND